AGAWGDANQTMRRVRLYQDMANALEELDKITIASVEGYCVGGGLEITMACDFVVCTESARWGMPEVDWGITPGWGGTTRMARLIGRRMTKEVNMLGALHPAGRGVELGLFNRAVPEALLRKEVRALIDLILLKNHQGLRQFKVMINRGVEADLYTAQGFELMGAGLTAAALGAWEIPDADGLHGWTAYRSGDPDSLIRKRREAARDFWTER
ncbi:MAG: enoyl-CoA hydratase/isomerase family protein, partial [Pseudomonadota bacterium]